jgi:hypothetical protein
MPVPAVRALQLGLSVVPRVDPRMPRSLTHITAAACHAVMYALPCSACPAAGPICGAPRRPPHAPQLGRLLYNIQVRLTVMPACWTACLHGQPTQSTRRA